MKVSAQMALVGSLIFAMVGFGVAITGFTSLGEITDAEKLADARGFAWFWMFLGTIGLAFAGVSWWIIRTHKDEGP